MSSATSGRAREHRTRARMETHGWQQVVRAAGSKGSADLIMRHPIHGGAFIQVGTHNKRLGPAARTRLLDDAEAFHALPLLASWSHTGLRLWHVTRDTPSTWEEFHLDDHR